LIVRKPPGVLPVALAMVMAVFCIGAGPALAQGEVARSRARALLQQGGQLYESGDYAGALEKFEAAYKLVPSPKLFFNMGQAYRGLARPVAGIEAFERFVAEARDASPSLRAEAQELIAALSRQVGELRIVASVEGASIFVDGRDSGSTPRAAPVRVAAGAHQVVLEKPGFRTFAQRVNVEAGGTLAVNAVLSPLSAPAPVAARPPADSPPATDDASPAVETTAEPAAEGFPFGHGGQIGAFLRVDFGLHPETGQRLAPGLSYGVNDIFELSAAAILGKLSKGAWVGGRAFLMQGRVKPSVNLGIPMFLSSPTAIGVQGGGGLTVELSANAGLFADLGGALFPGASSDDRVWLLISTGAQGRF
jgi:PEGA domain